MTAQRPATSGTPEILYHYTNVNAMIAIAKESKIWATSIKYLNDTTEGEHFLTLLRRRLPEVHEAFGLGHTISDYLGRKRQRVEEQPFIASFSREHDSLPQWRSYCPNGNGVAIGFRRGCLLQAFVEKEAARTIAPQIVSFEKVEYMSSGAPEGAIDDVIAELVREADQLVEIRRKLHRTIHEAAPLTREGAFATAAIREACKRKHRSFSREREYRLIVDPIFMEASDLDFRTVRSTLVPYVSLSIPKEPLTTADADPTSGDSESTHEDSKEHCIARVVVGPSPNMRLSLEAVRAFFRGLNMDVKVVRSRIPYRDL
jgi:hypothetical protein